MKYLIILLFLFFQIIYPQSLTFKGKVVDSESGKPLTNANIFVESAHLGTTCNEKGEFTLSGSFSGNDLAVISFIGYNSKSVVLSQLNTQSPSVIKLDPKILSSQTVLVTGSIAKEGVTPLAYSKIKREDIQSNYIDQDIPEYLSSLPSTTFYSEAGNGVGYNYLSIRGFDQRRISVAVNGIPQNDPEDHNVYWLDFPDILSSTELIQVQRGAGAGIIGYPSVGGSINIITSSFSDKPRFDFSSSLGSYNTRKYSASFASGLIENRYSLYVKLSKTLSSGYRNSAWSDFNAYHVSAVRYDNNFTSQINFYGGPIADGLSYTGLPKFAISDKELRKQNYSDWGASNGQYDYVVQRRPEEIENFSQPHFELLNEWNINKDMVFNSALFMVLGNGFFDYDASWADTSYFRLTSENGIHANSNPTNALVRAQVDNKQFGWIPRLSIKHQNGELILGSELRAHRSLHWGSINYADNLPDGIDKNFRYYQYNGARNIINFFANENYNLTDLLNLLAELQISYNQYRIYNEKYLGNDFKVNNTFFNPRIGINYKLAPSQNIYLSFARVSREPRLNNYYDAAESSGGEEPQFQKNSDGSYNFNDPLVKPETMNDIEAGTSFSTERMSLSLNLFYMIFKNEIVKNGKLDRFGQPITGNVDQTIHSGIELSGVFKAFEDLQLGFNGTLSKNYINKGQTFIKFRPSSEEPKLVQALDLSGNKIAGFPDFLLNAQVKYTHSSLLAILSGKYVGKFYSDNYDSKLAEYLRSFPGFVSYEDNQVDPYFTADLFFSYELNNILSTNSIKVFAQVNNIFDKLYAAYAIGGEFFPAAERNFQAGIQLGL
ncbi:MAG: TonB-dependent receptor [Clostridiales bacterium]